MLTALRRRLLPVRWAMRCFEGPCSWLMKKVPFVDNLLLPPVDVPRGLLRRGRLARWPVSGGVSHFSPHLSPCLLLSAAVLSIWQILFA